MGKPEEFVKSVEAALNRRIGGIIAGSIMKSNLSKMNTAVAGMTKEDCKVFIENIVKSVALFQSKEEAAQVKADLEGLLKTME